MTDIVEYVEQKFRSGNSVPIDRSWLSADEWAQLRAEIVRLRGEVAERADDLTTAYMAGRFDAKAPAPAEAKDPAPAMPNGVEGLAGVRDTLIVAANNPSSHGREIGLRRIMLEQASRIDAALRAADNRDAAGVSDRVRDLLLERRNRLMNSFGGTPYEDGRVQQQIDAIDEQLRATPAAVPSGEAVAVCGTCNGVGMIGGHRGQTPDSFEQWAEDCPDCTPQPADGEAVAWVCSPTENIAKHIGITSAERQRLIDNGFDVSHYRPLIYGDTTPPAPVQAAPQEGEAEALARKFHDTYERLAPSFGYETRQETRQFDPTTPNGRLMIAVCAELAAHPSACELGADTARLDWLEANCVDVADEYGTGSQLYFGTYATAPLRTAIDRALQHRGDSRGGEATP